MIVRPVNKISGIIESPDSKSHFIRLIAGALLADGESVIEFSELNDDIESALDVARTLGAEIFTENKKIYITGGVHKLNNVINCNESGLTFRMFAIISALSNEKYTITGKGTLVRRNITDIVSDLNMLGLNANAQNGQLPLSVSGKISNTEITIDGSQSSQVLSGILFALAANRKRARIVVENLSSKPYIDLTISTLSLFGINVENKSYKEFIIPENQKFKAIHTKVEGDWSGASFFSVAAAVGGRIELKGLDINSKQADKNIIKAVEAAGALVIYKDKSVIIEKKSLAAFDFDASDCPDLFPPLAVLAANCKGISKIKGTRRLIYKESNRAEVLKSEFAKLGINISIQDDVMYIKGGPISGARVNSNNDHRIAMALTLMSINSTGDIFVENPSVVSKSYTNFFVDFKNIIVH